MKLVTYIMKGDPLKEEKIGVLTMNDSEVLDLQKASEIYNNGKCIHFDNMIAFLSGREEAREIAQELVNKAGKESKVSIDYVKLLAPVPKPPMLRDTMCYEQHYINCQKTILGMKGVDPETVDAETLKPPKIWYDMPLFYKGNVNSIIGTGEEVTYPEGEQFKDYELELAFYINKEGKNINSKDALDYIGGFTILNDFSARMTQIKEMNNEFGLGPAISKDFANAMGPCMVTPDAFDYRNANMIVRVNGEERGRGNSGMMYHKIGDVIEYISNNITLYPGDVIATGTVPLGTGLEIGKFLACGDEIELEIEGIGLLKNKVVASTATKIRNKQDIYKRYVCAEINGKSDFVIEDNVDVTRDLYGDIWKITETPAAESGTVKEDQGNKPFEHEAPNNGSTFRFIPVTETYNKLPKLSSLKSEQRNMFVDIIRDMHRNLGTHYLPNEQDLEKHLTMHKTGSLNLFICLEGTPIALNDLDEINLQPGDALVQLGAMHGWELDGSKIAYLGGLLVDSDQSTVQKLTEIPKPLMESKHKKFKRYVCGTIESNKCDRGQSTILINDYAPNETEIFDESGKHIGYAGEIWKTFGKKADLSGKFDTITGPIEAKPPVNGITFRMVELLPHCILTTDESIVNYYSVIKGEINAISDERKITVKSTEHIVQLKSKMMLENTSDEPVVMAHYMIDAVK